MLFSNSNNRLISAVRHDHRRHPSDSLASCSRKRQSSRPIVFVTVTPPPSHGNVTIRILCGEIRRVIRRLWTG